MITFAQRDYCQALIAWHPTLNSALGISFPESNREVSTFIETFKTETLNRYGYRVGSMRAILADSLIRHGLNISRTYDEFVSQLGNEIGCGDYNRTIEFSSNPPVKGGKRIPKPLNEQREELHSLITKLADELRRRERTWETRQDQTGTETSTEPPSEPPNSSEEEETTQTQGRTESTVGSSSGTHPFLAKIREIRAEETRRTEIEGKRTPILEAVSGIRPAKNGAKMLKQGIPTEALLHALALDWPQEARRRYGIRDYDVTTFRNGDVPPGRHPAYSYAKAAMQARIPIAAIGPSGTGKSTLFIQLAKDMGMDYGMIPCNKGVTPSWFVGAYVLDPDNPYRSRSAMDMFRNGGLLVLEEFDAIDANIALLANNLIENDVFENPVTGEKIPRSDNFIAVACMNTKATGATSNNTGRTRLDDATRNRFAIGRFEMFVSESLETEVFLSHM